jgi:hypothetical protein
MGVSVDDPEGCESDQCRGSKSIYDLAFGPGGQWISQCKRGRREVIRVDSKA